MCGVVFTPTSTPAAPSQRAPARGRAATTPTPKPAPHLSPKSGAVPELHPPGLAARALDAALGLGVGVLSPELGLAAYRFMREWREERVAERQRENILAATLIAAAERGPRPPRPSQPQQAFTPAAEPDLGRWECPRCHRPLEVETISELHLHSCRLCGGLAIEATSLRGLFEPARQATLQTHATALAQGREREVDINTVRYLDCPRCSGPTLRRNFERVSGVMVDVCLQHAVWFDRDELPRAIGFLAGGGEARRDQVEAQEAERQAAERQRIARIEARTPVQQRDGLPDDLDLFLPDG